MGKTAERAAKARNKHGIPEDTRIWTAENGWVTYRDGLITVKMTLTPALAIPLQDIADLDFKAPTKLLRGHLRFNRSNGGSAPRQEMIFSKGDEEGFAELRNELERDRKLGLTGTLPEVAQESPSARKTEQETVRARKAEQAAEKAQVSDQEFRTKYSIPADAVLARSAGAGYVSFDGHYVTIQHLALGRVTIGKGVKRIPVTAISSIQIKPAGLVMAGFIQFSLSGGVEKQSSFGNQTKDAGSDENSMMIYGNEPDFLALRDAVEKAQRELHQPPAAPAAQADDVYAQLEKLGRLRDAGILTDAEFATKKADLLARM